MMLSPLNLSGLLSRQRATDEAGVVRDKKRRPAREVVQWACPVCGELYDECEETEAEACCQGEEPDRARLACPVCDAKAQDHRDAADCCLWKDLDAPTRWRMADDVEAGGTWDEELARIKAVAAPLLPAPTATGR